MLDRTWTLTVLCALAAVGLSAEPPGAGAQDYRPLVIPEQAPPSRDLTADVSFASDSSTKASPRHIRRMHGAPSSGPEPLSPAMEGGESGGRSSSNSVPVSPPARLTIIGASRVSPSSAPQSDAHAVQPVSSEAEKSDGPVDDRASINHDKPHAEAVSNTARQTESKTTTTGRRTPASGSPSLNTKSGANTRRRTNAPTSDSPQVQDARRARATLTKFRSKPISQYAMPQAPESPGISGLVLRLVGGTLVVMVVCFVSLRFARRWLVPAVESDSNSNRLRLLGTLNLGNRCQLQLVRSGSHDVLVGIDGTGLKTITSLPMRFEIDPSEMDSPESPTERESGPDNRLAPAHVSRQPLGFDTLTT